MSAPGHCLLDFDMEKFLLRLPGSNGTEGLRENGIVALHFRKEIADV